MVEKTVSAIKERAVEFMSQIFMENFGEIEKLELEIDMENLIED